MNKMYAAKQHLSLYFTFGDELIDWQIQFVAGSSTWRDK